MWPKLVGPAHDGAAQEAARSSSSALNAAVRRSAILANAPASVPPSENLAVHGLLPELSVAVEVLKLAFTRCPPRLGEVNRRLRLDHQLKRALTREMKTIASFFEDAAVFVLSRMWFDAISGYLLGLHAVPYCGGFLATQCAHEAPAGAQWRFALAALPTTALLKHLVEWSGLTSRAGFSQVRSPPPPPRPGWVAGFDSAGGACPFLFFHLSALARSLARRCP